MLNLKSSVYLSDSRTMSGTQDKKKKETWHDHVSEKIQDSKWKTQDTILRNKNAGARRAFMLWRKKKARACTEKAVTRNDDWCVQKSQCERMLCPLSPRTADITSINVVAPSAHAMIQRHAEKVNVARGGRVKNAKNHNQKLLTCIKPLGVL